MLYYLKRTNPRKWEILNLAANGLNDPQIAYRLGITHQTVRNNLTKLYQRYRVRNRIELITKAFHSGILEFYDE